jgi:hypothetical protein
VTIKDLEALLFETDASVIGQDSARKILELLDQEREASAKVMENLPPYDDARERSPMSGLEWWWYDSMRERGAAAIRRRGR